MKRTISKGQETPLNVISGCFPLNAAKDPIQKENTNGLRIKAELLCYKALLSLRLKLTHLS